MTSKDKNLLVESSLIEELSDEVMAACVGGCDLSVGLNGYETSVPLTEVPLLGLTTVQVSLLGNSVSTEYDPNGSIRGRSDRNVKDHFSEVNAQQVLEKVAALPITSWNYKDENPEVRHIGPMAQDFAETFKVGDDNRYINLIDANGVALAAIQALYRLVQEKDTQIRHLSTDLENLKQELLSQRATV